MARYRVADTSGLPGLGFTAIRKSADQAKTTDTTLADDDELVFSIGASEHWIADVALYVTLGAGLFQFTVTVPTSATMLVTGFAMATAADTDGDAGIAAIGDIARIALRTSGTAAALSATAVETNWVVHLRIAVENSTNAGTVDFQWAQASSNAAATTVKEGSSVIAYRVS